MHPVRRPHLHLPPRAPQRRFSILPPPAHRSGARSRVSGSTMRPHSPTNASSQRRAPVQSCRGHITRQRGQARSFVQANDMPKRNLGRDPREIRFAGVVMTNGCSLPVRITRQVKQEFLQGGNFCGNKPRCLSKNLTRKTGLSHRCHFCEEKKKNYANEEIIYRILLWKIRNLLFFVVLN